MLNASFPLRSFSLSSLPPRTHSTSVSNLCHVRPVATNHIAAFFAGLSRFFRGEQMPLAQTPRLLPSTPCNLLMFLRGQSGEAALTSSDCGSHPSHLLFFGCEIAAG